MAAVVMTTVLFHALGVQGAVWRSANESSAKDLDDEMKEIVLPYCKRESEVCGHGGTSVCARRDLPDGSYEERTFDSHCVLLLTNACSEPGREFHVTWPVRCEDKSLRRQMPRDWSNVNVTAPRDWSTNVTTSRDWSTNVTTSRDWSNVTVPRGWSNSSYVGNSSLVGNSSAALRYTYYYKADRPKTYAVQITNCNHKCPPSCNEAAYSPVCMNINRLEGKSFVFMVFRNHCMMDMYYCEHVKALEKIAPKHKIHGTNARSLNCAHNRWTNYMSFTTIAQSMFHFGWTEGGGPLSRVLSPEQRQRLGTAR